ncbi:MAG: hypothetical protein PHO70_07075 [Candidatus Omnitrophica bacterium]|nr:hypothetical protein [Candidatus Omnitrophota bacterium]
MEQKIKYILVGLIGLSLVFLFLFVSTLTSKQQIIQQKDELEKNLASKEEQLTGLENKLRKAENESTAIKGDLNKALEDRQELEKQLEMLAKAKDELMLKLKERQAQQIQEVSQIPVTSDAYWAGILKNKTDLEFQLSNIRNELKTMQINNEQLLREKTSMDLDLNTLKREKEDLSRQLDYNQKIMDSISQELVRERNDKIQIQSTFKSLRNENTILSRQLKSLNSRKITLERKVQTLQEDKAGIERRLNEMETMLTDRLSQVNDLKDEIDAIRNNKLASSPKPAADKDENVELSPIVVRPYSDKSSSSHQDTSVIGRVLAVNRDNKFVVVDLGEEAGARAGDTFYVYRQDERIGTIEVIKTSKSVSACDIKKERKDMPIKKDDTIR